MLRLGLTGGIGAGKTTVAQALARLGAVVVDADQLARRVVEPGSPGLDAVVVHDVPLLVENGLGPDYQLVLVVAAPVEERVRRLVRDRGMAE